MKIPVELKNKEASSYNCAAHPNTRFGNNYEDKTKKNVVRQNLSSYLMNNYNYKLQQIIINYENPILRRKQP